MAQCALKSSTVEAARSALRRDTSICLLVPNCISYSWWMSGTTQAIPRSAWEDCHIMRRRRTKPAKVTVFGMNRVYSVNNTQYKLLNCSGTRGRDSAKASRS